MSARTALHVNKSFSTLTLIGGKLCPHPDLEVFGGMKVNKTGCFGGSLSAQNVYVQGYINGQSSPSAAKYQISAQFNYDDFIDSMPSVSPLNPQNLDFSSDFPSIFYHLFAGPVGQYTVTMLVESNNNTSTHVNISELTQAQMNETDPAANNIGSIGPINSSGPRMLVTGTVTTTMSPSIWFYWNDAAGTTREIYDLYIVQA